MASSVELGPGIRLMMLSRSRKRSSLIHLRCCTTSWRIMAMCAAGPPKAVKPRRRKKRVTSVSLVFCVFIGFGIECNNALCDFYDLLAQGWGFQDFDLGTAAQVLMVVLYLMMI